MTIDTAIDHVIDEAFRLLGEYVDDGDFTWQELLEYLEHQTNVGFNLRLKVINEMMRWNGEIGRWEFKRG